MLRKLTSFATLVKLPFIGDDLVTPLATDLSTAQFLQLGWVYKRGHELHCRLGGTPETLPAARSVIVGEGDDKEYVIPRCSARPRRSRRAPGEERYGAGCVTGAFPKLNAPSSRLSAAPSSRP